MIGVFRLEKVKITGERFISIISKRLAYANIFLIVLMFLDTLTTWYGLELGFGERSTFINFLVLEFGLVMAMLIKSALSVVVFFIIDFYLFLLQDQKQVKVNVRKIFLILLALILGFLIANYFFAVINNFYLLFYFKWVM